MKFNPTWYLVDVCGTCLVRQGGNPANIADRVAFIEKTPRVRTGHHHEDLEYLNWTPGPKGTNAQDQESRAWCLEKLKSMGWTPDMSDDLSKATDALNDKLFEAEKVLQDMARGVEGYVILSSLSALSFRKVEDVWGLFLVVTEGGGHPPIRLVNASRTNRIQAAQALVPLLENMQQRYAAERGLIARATASVDDFLARAVQVEV